MKNPMMRIITALDGIKSFSCKVTVFSAVAFTALSVTRMIINAKTPLIWLCLVYISLGFSVLSVLFSLLELAALHFFATPEIYRELNKKSSQTIIREEQLWGKVYACAGPFFILNLMISCILLKGDGRNLRGTWLGAAGQMPVYTAVFPVFPVVLRQKVQKMIIKWHPDFNHIRNNIYFKYFK